MIDFSSESEESDFEYDYDSPLRNNAGKSKLISILNSRLSNISDLKREFDTKFPILLSNGKRYVLLINNTNQGAETMKNYHALLNSSRLKFEKLATEYDALHTQENALKRLTQRISTMK